MYPYFFIVFILFISALHRSIPSCGGGGGVIPQVERSMVCGVPVRQDNFGT